MPRALACFATLALLTLPLPSPAAPEQDSLSVNIGLASQYRYRGLMQTNNRPAVSGGVDYQLANGLYIGNWNSSISWLNDSNPQVSAPIEMDFYGGYKGELTTDMPFDIGVMQYYYPGDYPSGYTRPNTTELYAGLGYGPLFFKYSHSLSNLFGFAGTQHSQYFDLSANVPLGFWGLTVNAHAGYQYVRNLDQGSYWDWKLGLTKDFSQGWSAQLAYVDTNANRAVYTNSHGRDMGRGGAVLSVSRSF
ncbi:TorF family putative porin [Bordetella avium]|uniref:TorF family putative porin n=1 Tax=Bordetella avium TaxID=521 RepID=UPI000E68C06F|nr:TorF family putative porin [Bordetella avium]AZY53405.1 hypothetical protein C0J07_13675 [Bordetella avium]RIQ68620.1 hypothetical protein D0839_11200 [Bordetella avium]